MSNLTIRTAIGADVSSLRTIYRESSLANAGDREVLLAHPHVLEWDAAGVVDGRTRVALMGETIVGFATLGAERSTPELEDLFVDPAWMRRGIGSALVRDAAALVAAQRGATLDVIANDHAMAFYTQAGFRPVGERATEFGPAMQLRMTVPQLPMARAALAEARAFASWLDYQHALVRAIAPLTDQQLQQRPVPGRRTPGEIAQHIVFGRALHVQRTLGDEAAELLPFVRWGDADAPQRSATELVRGLEVTWRVIADYLMRGAAGDEIPVPDEMSPLQVIWGLLDHDLPHAGQLSLLLRAGGLPGVDI